MNDKDMDPSLARRLAAEALLAQRREGDVLALADDVMLAALDGRRALTPAQAAALTASPLTVRRFRQLSLERRQQRGAANDPVWEGSGGLLRAASTGDLAGPLKTDDGYWSLHVAGGPGAWRLILALDPQAPFAPVLLRASGGVRVLDGEGGTLLEGVLDADGECEAAWPHASAPFEHLQQAGAVFSVRPN